MFETFDYITLQQYWWIIVSLLGALLVFLMFVQGGQTLIFSLPKDEEEKNLIINTLGRKWELTFTTLVTFGGAAFASFPLFYSTSFGGAYWVWVAILFCFIIQAVSYEYRSKPNNFLGKKTYEMFLFINGSIGVILLGTAIGTFFTGSEFYINEYNQSFWQTKSRGLEAALNLNNVVLGLVVFFLVRILGAMYFINSIKNDSIALKARNVIKTNSLVFIPLFLYFVIQLLLREGYHYNEASIVSLVKYKYLNNLLEMPIILVLFLIGVVLVLFGIYKAILKNTTNPIWFGGIGTILTVFSLLLIAGLNNTCFYPSSYNIQSSLNIVNASSSRYTLTAMSYVSLLVPFVVAYIYYVWLAMNKKQIDKNDLNDKDSHIY
ncbi:MAG: cytochrome d ubiquinol oxidase subunit II [Bacteroidetes bacterium GWE2_29_8]|nr:MAG: cytochrome d ubiquinol oxidase subunit II [Bacteroidetes bacterium GWE2_29_8]